MIEKGYYLGSQNVHGSTQRTKGKRGKNFWKLEIEMEHDNEPLSNDTRC